MAREGRGSDGVGRTSGRLTLVSTWSALRVLSGASTSRTGWIATTDLGPDPYTASDAAINSGQVLSWCLPVLQADASRREGQANAVGMPR
jgi:hypothetical protein